MHLKNRTIFQNSLPICFPYLTVGASFGALFVQKGGSVFESFLISVTSFAGLAQFASLEYYNQSNFLVMFVAIFLINLRHIFYTSSSRKILGKINMKGLYLTGALTDENFGILHLYKNYNLTQTDLIKIFGLNHLYWILGCTLGALVGDQISSIKGIDFFLVSLFLVLFIDRVKELIK